MLRVSLETVVVREYCLKKDRTIQSNITHIAINIAAKRTSPPKEKCLDKMAKYIT